MKNLKAIAADQPMSALEKAVWWIEYVLRHNGAKHLRYGGVDMPLYQYYMLDVFAFLGFLLFLVLNVLYRIFPRIVIGYHIVLRIFSYIKQFLPQLHLHSD